MQKPGCQLWICYVFLALMADGDSTDLDKLVALLACSAGVFWRPNRTFDNENRVYAAIIIFLGTLLDSFWTSARLPIQDGVAFVLK